jgi:hypothetical protein
MKFMLRQQRQWGEAIVAHLARSSHEVEEPTRIPLFDMVGDMRAVHPDEVVPIELQTSWLMADPVCVKLAAVMLRHPQEGDLPLTEQLTQITLDAELKQAGVDVEALDVEYADEFDAEARRGPQPLYPGHHDNG